MIGYWYRTAFIPRVSGNPKVRLPFVNLGSQKNHMAFIWVVLRRSEVEGWFEESVEDEGKTSNRGVAFAVQDGERPRQ